jgi:nucleotide-binding universal stress UspA family protein
MSTPVERMMVYIDGTEESLTAVEFAVLLAKSSKAELVGCYVVNTRALGELVRTRIFLESEEREYSRDLEADADRYLNHARKIAEAKDVVLKTVKRKGNVHQEILKVVEEEKIDLLVLGELAHVRSRRDEFYNEAERAMRSVRCSVLIVKDEARVASLFGRVEH